MAALTGRSIKEIITEEEQAELNEWLNERDRNRLLFEAMKNDGYREKVLSLSEDDTDIEKAWAIAKQKLYVREQQPKFRTIYRYLTAAAMVAILVGCLVYFFTVKNKPVTTLGEVTTHDVPPGVNKAVLTLANGRQIVFDSNANGVLAQQGNMQVINLSTGQLVYKSVKGNAGTDEEVQYNILTTPKGGQYKVTLPDGSKVWLNAASSLEYPTAFTGKERSVALTGEAFFEVAQKPDAPFMVDINGTSVTVLGTSFNVQAYTDEPGTRTTLVSGAVSITSGDNKKILKPGEMATVSEGKISIRQVDTANIIAWKNDLFCFRETTIPELMRQLARWYDIEVIYSDNYQMQAHFTGEISRNVPISKVIEMIEKTGVANFKIEGRTIEVSSGTNFPKPKYNK